MYDVWCMNDFVKMTDVMIANPLTYIHTHTPIEKNKKSNEKCIQHSSTQWYWPERCSNPLSSNLSPDAVNSAPDSCTMLSAMRYWLCQGSCARDSMMWANFRTIKTWKWVVFVWHTHTFILYYCNIHHTSLSLSDAHTHKKAVSFQIKIIIITIRCYVSSNKRNEMGYLFRDTNCDNTLSNSAM